jgi:hypothetical protein
MNILNFNWRRLGVCFLIYCTASAAAQSVNQDTTAASRQEGSLTPVLDCSEAAGKDVYTTRGSGTKTLKKKGIGSKTRIRASKKRVNKVGSLDHSINQPSQSLKTEAKPCKSAIPDAPEVYEGLTKNYATPRVRTTSDGQIGSILGITMIAVPSESYLGGLHQVLIEQLMNSHQTIAYSGSASGEILITTKPTDNPSGDIKTWYQIRLVARPCDTPMYMCGISGGVTLITKQANTGGPPKVFSSTDSFSNRLENVVSTYVANTQPPRGRIF